MFLITRPTLGNRLTLYLEDDVIGNIDIIYLGLT